jgi:hypothetical protein
MQKTVIYVDASSLKDCGGCYRKYYLNNLKGYNLLEEKEYKMAYGTGFHKFAENFYSGVSVKDSIQIAVDYYSEHLKGIIFPEDEFRTPSHLIQVCKKYAESFGSDVIVPIKSLQDCPNCSPKEPDKEHAAKCHTCKDTGKVEKPLVEAKFAIPWFHTSLYEFILCGTIDLVCLYDGELCLVDHKTTGTYLGNSDGFLKGFELDIQAALYCYIYKSINNLEKAPVFLVNGVFIKKPTDKAAKSGYFDGVAFKRSSVIYYSNEKLQDFSTWLERWRFNMLALLEVEESALYDQPNFAFCKNSFGLCKYFPVCSAPVDCRKGILEYSYLQKEYNPLKFRD